MRVVIFNKFTDKILEFGHPIVRFHNLLDRGFLLGVSDALAYSATIH